MVREIGQAGSLADLQLSIKVQKIVTGELTMPVPLDDGAYEVTRRGYVTSLKIYENYDAMVKYIIECSVRPEAKQHILTCNSGKEMWDVLHSVYEQKNERRLDLLYSQLFSYHKDPINPIVTHVSKLQSIWHVLHELKIEHGQLPQSILLIRILNTLPDEYFDFKNAL
ncbi:hypothetical protein NQ314_002027 [Rhamnusium bicolor]|uniref:Uncharacterized protein n=1 Tax=Rhamnusium bicolor TaxID=1586634 RepID=A0AAV8ZQY2_9CUCU|nr:hypothetical protein NQ314_002027 [Rhamnusium bicolor]